MSLVPSRTGTTVGLEARNVDFQGALVGSRSRILMEVMELGREASRRL